jgi:adenosylcobyric acid synthase
MSARAIMFMGTGSDVGKSLIVAGLCRYFSNRGLRVAPFKPQNMSNNAAVTSDGGEIGRAQALQARAARRAPVADMNPVLLKPQSGNGAQIVVQGRMQGSASAREFQAIKAKLMPAVLESFARLSQSADLVLIEGAGSASEINLRRNDIANMGFARAAGVPVVLIGDIDRGGVIAAIAGTKYVIAPEDGAMICGFIVNKMRGDVSLFRDGMDAIASLTGWQDLGLVPYFDAARLLPAEDALGLRELMGKKKPDAVVTIAVPHLPHISNFDDLDPLRAEPQLSIELVEPGTPLPPHADVIVLPGSKCTIADLAVLRDAGWDKDIASHVRHGGKVVGLCGGYQMLGLSISDPHGIEGSPQTVDGLQLLDIDTVFGGEKTLVEVSGVLAGSGAPFNGYEMHVGQTKGPATARPMLTFADGRCDGAISINGRVQGCYVHGLFSSTAARSALLAAFGATSSANDHEAGIENTLDALAEHLGKHIDTDTLLKKAR